MKKFFVLSVFAVAAIAFTGLTNGCISNTKYGCDVTETLAPGAPEGAVIMRHVAPGNIV